MTTSDVSQEGSTVTGRKGLPTTSRSLTFFVTLFALAGDDRAGGHWPGAVVGGLAAVPIGLVSGGAGGWWIGGFYPPGFGGPDRRRDRS